MENKELVKKLCQVCIDTYKGEHGRVKNVLKNVTKIDTGRVEADIGILDDKYTVVAFRGSDGFEDWRSNLDFKKILFYPEYDNKIKVHRGFCEQWGEIQPRLVHSLFYDYYFLLCERHGLLNPLLITGHSLGGALATLCSLCWSSPHIKSFNPSGCVTFGSPRVGNKAFVKHYNSRMKEQNIFSLRIVNGEDSICKVPTSWMGFRHVSSKVKIGRPLAKRLGFETILAWPFIKIFGNIFDHYPERYLKNI